MSFFVTLVRHGETDFNLAKQSDSNISINTTGIAQAEALGSRLANEKFTKVYSSDLIRTQDTTKVVLKKSTHPPPKVELDKNLRERDMGQWEATPMAREMLKIDNGKINFQGLEVGSLVQLLSIMNPPGGETHEQIMTRITEFFEELCKTCDETKESENVLVVTHGLWLISFLAYFQTNQNDKFEIHGLDTSCLSLDSLTKASGPQNTCVTKMVIHKISPGKEGANCQRKIEMQDTLNSSHLKDICHA